MIRKAGRKKNMTKEDKIKILAPIIESACINNPVSFNDIVLPSVKTPAAIKARREIIHAAYIKGLSFASIGKALNMHKATAARHCTIAEQSNKIN